MVSISIMEDFVASVHGSDRTQDLDVLLYGTFGGTGGELYLYVLHWRGDRTAMYSSANGNCADA